MMTFAVSPQNIRFTTLSGDSANSSVRRRREISKTSARHIGFVKQKKSPKNSLTKKILLLPFALPKNFRKRLQN